ncbi:hypothetical protein [Apilactobacillus nanyangensis]|uniref:hypothetical protein n=1 Tax=Apilactobacillus nanyangensis TaxID=2799579 RepID=UPI001940DBDE|nr:hypothetical protein [Apilactobacillus nanyangensis]
MNNEVYTIFTVCGWIWLLIMVVAQRKEMSEWVENIAFTIAIICFVIALLINVIPGK